MTVLTRERRSSSLTAVVVLVGILVVPMSISGSAVALPRIGADLQASGAALQWVMNAYNLTFASFMLVSGSLADLFGRRKVFALGAAVFALGSVLGAAAQDIWLLDAARALSGVGAAGVFAGGAAILATTFDGPARTRAFAALGVVAGIGLALGPTISGWLVGGLGWRALFLLNAFVLVVALAGSALMPESRAAERPAVDVKGAVLFVAGLALLTVGVVQGSESGWGSPPVLALLAAAVALFVIFARTAGRTANPILDLRLLRNRRFLAVSLVPVATSFGFVTLLTFLPTYLISVNGVSAQGAGAWMLMLTAPVLIVPTIGGALVNRGVSARGLVTGGVLLFAVGNAWLALVDPSSGFAGLAGPLMVIGAAVGLLFGVGDGMAMSMVEPEKAGMAAGFFNTMRIGSEAVVIAVFGSMLLTLIQARVGDAELAGRVAAGAGGRLAADFTGAFHTLLWGIAAICLAMAAGIHAMLKPARG
ncbi:MFS transporter [Microtetraspora malaysiensis]|uniref:MFS transporter n=1 Tax=Microtetraspora malaysiensis TaxID=161358 RepID=UPI003D8BB2B8